VYEAEVVDGGDQGEEPPTSYPDAGILVLLALDLLLTWLRMPLPLLRHAAWRLTAATVTFNGASAWPDPLGAGIHAAIPLHFVTVVEATRHAVGRSAEIKADCATESVRLARWLLSPLPTFLLWRRMKLWERSYLNVLALEQPRRVERARLPSRYGRRWRSKAPVGDVIALRLTRYGRPLAPVEGLLAATPAAAGDLPPLPSPAPAPARPALAIAEPEVPRRIEQIVDEVLTGGELSKAGVAPHPRCAARTQRAAGGRADDPLWDQDDRRGRAHGQLSRQPAEGRAAAGAAFPTTSHGLTGEASGSGLRCQTRMTGSRREQ
jgi:hypothetical protein